MLVISNTTTMTANNEPAMKFIKPDDPDLEVIEVGPASIRILEDGSNTDNRFGAVHVTLGAQTPGPTALWHRMNDTTFLVTKGRFRFYTATNEPRDVTVGDYVVVPPGAVHRFDNPFDEEGEFLNTFSPAYYVDAIRIIAKKTAEAVKEGRFPLSREEQLAIMAQFATFPPEVKDKY